MKKTNKEKKKIEKIDDKTIIAWSSFHGKPICSTDLLKIKINEIIDRFNDL